MRRIVPILAGVLLLAAVALGLWLRGELAAPETVFPEEGVFVELPRGASVRQVARLLEDRGVVRSARAFEWLCRWHRSRPPQAGEYHFSEPQPARAVFERLAAGRIYTRPLLVREGLTMREIAELVENEGFCPREEFLAAAADPAVIADLAPAAKNLEGFLFPATYEFPRRASGADIVAAMVRRFRQVWQPLAAEGANSHGLSPLELVTMASLVERETGRRDERGAVAGVFYNRLQRGMALQCDPTVVYALELAGQWRGQLLLRDLRFDSPYNTYRYRGLPPGPIANPGRAALEAALAPEETEYLYFVSDNEGGHWFSRTLAEHNRNVARYRERQAEAARAARDAARDSPRNGGRR
jgi:UPF0755 protein